MLRAVLHLPSPFGGHCYHLRHLRLCPRVLLSPRQLPSRVSPAAAATVRTTGEDRWSWEEESRRTTTTQQEASQKPREISQGTATLRGGSAEDLKSTNWEEYVSERQSQKGLNKSLERQAITSFGSIRLDQMNVPVVDGQEDIYLDVLEKELGEEDEELAEAELPIQEGANPGIGQLRSRYYTSSSSGAVGSQVRDRNFFFEGEVPAADAAVGATRPNQQATTRTISDEGFSFRPAVKMEKPYVKQRIEVATLRPEFDQQPSTPVATTAATVPIIDEVKKVLSAKENFIESQYFTTVKTAEPNVANSLVVEERKHDEETKALSGLNAVDEQYFAISKLKTSDVVEDVEKVRELVQESTKDLTYVDSQIFFEQPDMRVHSYEEDVLEVRRDVPTVKASDVRFQEDVKEKKTTEQQQRKVKAPIKNKPITANELQVHASNSALEFVQSMRRLDETSAGKKQQLAADFEIGTSLQKRLTKAAQVITVDDLKARADNEKVAAQKEPPRAPKDVIFTRLDPKFKPANLSDMTSLEMMELLQQSIVYNDNDILALNKPYDLPMFGDDEPHTVEKYLSKLAAKVDAPELFQVHRLDRTTSGILLLAKSREMHKLLANLFRKRMIDKRYWAVVRGVPQPSQGIIDIPIGEVKLEDSRYCMTVQPNYKSSSLLANKKSHYRSREVFPAVTEYKVLSSYINISLLEVKPITGFKHQIRVHLGLGLGCPVIGDHKYTTVNEIGKPQKLSSETLHRFGIRQSRVRDLPIYLHAKHMQIPDIVPGKQVWIDAPLPHFFNRAMQKLKLKPRDFVSI